MMKPSKLHIARGNESSGPYPIEQVYENLDQGILRLDDLAYHKRLDSWTPLREIDLKLKLVPTPTVTRIKSPVAIWFKKTAPRWLDSKQSNPMFWNKNFSANRIGNQIKEGMTATGAVNKAGILLFIILLTACLTWWLCHEAQTDGSPVSSIIMISAFVCVIAGLILSQLTPKISFIIAPVGCIALGIFLGALSSDQLGIGNINKAANAPHIDAMFFTLPFFSLLSTIVAFHMDSIKSKWRNHLKAVIIIAGPTLLSQLAIFTMVLIKTGDPLSFKLYWVKILFYLACTLIWFLLMWHDFKHINFGGLTRAAKYTEWQGAYGLVTNLVWVPLFALPMALLKFMFLKRPALRRH